MTETASQSFKWGPWTPAEDEFLRSNRGKLTVKEMSLQIGRTAAAITKRFGDLKHEAAVPVNGSEPEAAAQETEAAPESAAATPAVPIWAAPSPRQAVLRDIEGAVCGLTQVLASHEITWDREDGFYAVKLLLEAWDRIRSLDE